MAATANEESSTTIVLTPDEVESTSDNAPVLRLHLNPPDSSHRVVWASDVVDNEHLNRKKSKCCCIYKKPRAWDESSSSDESDTECDHCHGHVEKKKSKSKPGADHDHDHCHGHGDHSTDPGNAGK